MSRLGGGRHDGTGVLIGGQWVRQGKCAQHRLSLSFGVRSQQLNAAELTR